MRDMKLQRAIVLSTWLYSLLFWLYVVARITINNIDPNDRFISRVPYITFFTVGVLSFALSFICLVVYLTNWEFGGDKTIEKNLSKLFSKRTREALH